MKVIEIMLRMVRTVKKSLVTRGRHKKRKKEKKCGSKPYSPTVHCNTAAQQHYSTTALQHNSTAALEGKGR